VLLITGDLVEEFHVKWTDWLSQAVRFYDSDPYLVEHEWLVGPIPIE
jgi:hypothetical protein